MKGFVLVAGLAIAGWQGAAYLLDDGLKGCDVDGDGVVYTVTDDNVVKSTGFGAYNYDDKTCFTSDGHVQLDRIEAVNHAGTPLQGFTAAKLGFQI